MIAAIEKRAGLAAAEEPGAATRAGILGASVRDLHPAYFSVEWGGQSA